MFFGTMVFGVRLDCMNRSSTLQCSNQIFILQKHRAYVPCLCFSGSGPGLAFRVMERRRRAQFLGFVPRAMDPSSRVASVWLSSLERALAVCLELGKMVRTLLYAHVLCVL